MDSLSKKIERYRAAQKKLVAIFEQNNEPTDQEVISADEEFREAFEALETIELNSEADLISRIEFFLDEIVLLSRESQLVQNLCKKVSNDLATYRSLAASKTVPSDAMDAMPEWDLIELCYVSKASNSFGLKDIEAIKSEAQTYNIAHGITGILTYDEKTNRFFQVLEGTRKNVQELLTKIINDKRHYDLDMRFQSLIQQRLFSEWAMFSTTTSQIQAELQQGDDFEVWINKLLSQKPGQVKTQGHQWLVRNINPLVSQP